MDRAIADHTTFETFREDFERIVAERWLDRADRAKTAQSTGGRGGRGTIYDTNLFTPTAPVVIGKCRRSWGAALLALPVQTYQCGAAEHLAWDGMILRHDDPLVGSGQPPNGFNCFRRNRSRYTNRMRAIETLRRGDQVFGGEWKYPDGRDLRYVRLMVRLSGYPRNREKSQQPQITAS